MRVALFGGTFDPPHRGHLGIAAAAADVFALDRVLFAPTGQQPLKVGRDASPFADRLAMVGLACKADPRFAASTVDAPRADGSPNYTVDALAQLAGLLPHVTLYNLVGADSFLSLRQWHEPEKLLALAEWIVVSRPRYPLDNLASLELTEAERSRVHLLETVHEGVSATMLRERLAAGDDCDDFLPEAVASYVRSHGLYR